jgi:outer membrane protein OmpA-like peptidoglycan-associated protein
MKRILVYCLLSISSYISFAQNSIEVENLGASVNSKYDELVPLISADGRLLYFIVGNHPLNTYYSSDKGSQDIWYSELDSDGKWGKATHAAFPFNEIRYNAVSWISPEGNRLLIKGYYEEGELKRNLGVSFCYKTKTGWSIPAGQKIRNLEEMQKGKYFEVSMSNDSKTLLMSFSEVKSSEYSNLYFSQLENDSSWSRPKSMGKLFESRSHTFNSPFLASDGITLYFSSDRPGGLGSNDIWMCKRMDDSWQNWNEPVNLGEPINTANWESGFSLDATGNYGYLVSSFNSIGRSDIVRIRLSDNIRPNPVVLLYGNVYNGKTKEPLSASLLYESLPDGKNAGNAYSSPVDGNYKLVLPYGKFYSFRASANNFIGISENLDLTITDQYKEIRKDLYLVPIEKGQTIRLNSIFFDLGKATLREESFPELDRLLVILQENPKLEIEISGHTDNVGGDASNMKLSNERANAVTTYLNYRGIPINRIIPKGYGKTKPANTNATEEGRQLNRRVEFTILKN